MKKQLFMASFFLSSSMQAQFLPEIQEEIQKEIPTPYDSIRAIDMHIHAGSFEQMGPLGQEFLLDKLPQFVPPPVGSFLLKHLASMLLNPHHPLYGTMVQCQQAGLSHCGLLGLYAPETWGNTTHEDIISWLDHKNNKIQEDGIPYFFGLAGVPVTYDWKQYEKKHLLDLKKVLKHPHVVGIKLAFVHTETRFDDTSYRSIYQLADKMNVPVYHHTGSTPLQPLSKIEENKKEQYIASADPKKLEWAFIQYPEVNFILGHMGFDFNHDGMNYMEDTLYFAEKYPNVYLEISAFGTEHHDPTGATMDYVLWQIRERNLISKTIYGCDVTGVPGGIKKYFVRVKNSMLRMNYSYEDAEKILRKNAVSLFKLKTND